MTLLLKMNGKIEASVFASSLDSNILQQSIIKAVAEKLNRLQEK